MNTSTPPLLLKTFAAPLELRSQRTLLRRWTDADAPPWVAMNTDPQVRRHFERTSTEAEALAELQRMRANLERRGWGMWALEIPGRIGCAGTVGLHVTGIDLACVPCVELGWRLNADAWGQGYASEAARAACHFAFEQLGLDELVAYTAAVNEASRRVMQRLGMQHDPLGNFVHPFVAPEHPVAPHVLYRLRRADFHNAKP